MPVFFERLNGFADRFRPKLLRTDDPPGEDLRPIQRMGALPALVLLGACVRLLFVSRQSFWYDEAVAAELSKHAVGELLHGLARDNGNPPLYWMLLHFWSRVFGTSDGALRMLSVAFGVLCIPLVYALGCELATYRIAGLATLLFAVSPYQVYLSQEARVYTLFVFLGMLSAFSLLRALDKPHLARYWILHAFATCAMCYAHYYAFFMVVAEVAFILVHPNLRRVVFARALVSFAAAAIGFLPWLPSFLVQLHTRGSVARSVHTWWLHAAATPVIFGLGRTLIWKQDVTNSRIVVAVLGGLALVTTLAVGLWAARRTPRGVFLYLWFGINLGIPWLVSAALSPLYAERYGALASIPYYFFVAYGLDAWGGKLRWISRVAIGMAITISLALYFTSTVKTDWRSAVRYVETHSKRGDLLLFDADFNETSYARYATLPNQRLRILGPPSSTRMPATEHAGGSITDAAQEIVRHPRVWLVLSDAEPGSANRYRTFFSSWTWSNEVVFRGIGIWLLQQRDDAESSPAVPRI